MRNMIASCPNTIPTETGCRCILRQQKFPQAKKPPRRLTSRLEEVLLQTTLSRTDHSALWQGLVCGTILGAMLLVFNLVNNLGNLDATGETWLKNGWPIVMFALPGLAGYIGSIETGRVKSGALAVLVIGFVSAII